MKTRNLTLVILTLMTAFCLYGQEGIDVEGAIKLGNTPNEEAGIIKWNGVDFLGYDGAQWHSLFPDGAGHWSPNGNKIYYNSDNVGIGNTNPLSLLHLTGGNLRIDGSYDIQWYEGASLKTYIDYDGTNLSIVNDEISGNMLLQTRDLLTLASYNGENQVTLQDNGNFHFDSDVSYGARLFINDENSNEMIRLAANESGSDGAEIRMRNGAGIITLELDADNAQTQGSLLLLDDDNSNNRVRLESNETVSQGAKLELMDFDGTLTAYLDGDDGGLGGRMNLATEVGTNGAYMEARSGANQGGRLVLVNGAGQQGINMHANSTDTEGGRILIDDIDGTTTLVLDGDNSGQGAIVSLQNEVGTEMMLLQANASASSGALLTMDDQSNSRTVTLNADRSGQGGALFLENENSLDMVRLYANEAVGQGGAIYLDNEANQAGISMQSNEASGNGSAIKLYDDAGNATIELDAQVGSGDARIYTETLQITGGSDLSEQFDINSEEGSSFIKPGMLVSIDPGHAGDLMVTNTPYDQKVVGAISGANGINPGMLMGQKGSEADGAHPVALTGRTYVYCDATYGSIEVGDILTSSPTPGHAMKVKKRKKASGAIIGKAMTSLKDGKGFVLVFVNLQ